MIIPVNKLLGAFEVAVGAPTGFYAEQVLHNQGFYQLGRRHDAAAWTKPEAEQVIRISRDSLGSTEYFKMAKAHEGNPYFPIVYGQETLKCGDHISCIERLETPGHAVVLAEYKEVKAKLSAGEPITDLENKRKLEIEYQAGMIAKLHNFFMKPESDLNVEELPNLDAFREASIAMLKLSEKMNSQDSRYIPLPDMNPSNILWRRTSIGFQPVLYDSVSRNHDTGSSELTQANLVRSRFDMSPL